jgi:hypothetical protein
MIRIFPAHWWSKLSHRVQNWILWGLVLSVICSLIGGAAIAGIAAFYFVFWAGLQYGMPGATAALCIILSLIAGSEFTLWYVRELRRRRDVPRSS